MTNPILSEELEWLYSTQLFGIKLGLENTKKLLAAYCSPLRRGTQVIQVAGTNGKGSTSAFIESVARAHGRRTGLFTSPHLVAFSERIRVAGQEIPDEVLAQLLSELRYLVAEWDPHPTFFELTLALAMRYFHQSDCEFVILEVGMGGRLDATTAVPSDLSVITPIAMDHQKYLGDTLELIAGEKAGILRQGVPCCTSVQDPAALSVIRQEANEKRCELVEVSAPLRGYALGLSGEHQRWNAALALEALHHVLGSLNYQSVSEGLRTVSWLGRFQEINTGETLTILDCAHNEQAAHALVAQWQDRFRDQKAHLIFGAAKDKSIAAILKILEPIVGSVEVYQIQNVRAEKAKSLRDLAKERLPNCSVQILEQLTDARSQPLILVTGSLFLVGEWLDAVSLSSS